MKDKPRIDCCWHCTERHELCHATCKEYQEQRALLDAWNAERLAESERRAQARDYAEQRHIKKILWRWR